MFKINDVVVYGTTGVCRFDGVSEVKLGREVKQYYVLTPVAQGSSTVLVPTDNELLLQRVRTVLTKAEIDAVIDSLPDGEIWCDDAGARMRLFADVLKSGDRGQILLVIRTLVLRRREFSARGKKLHLADERALRDAQRLLFDEFSYVLGIAADKVEDYIISAVSASK